ncbi:hypothetical protein ABBQ32_009814 [Trebouxia sp. C0010 RCD-2024]
MFLPHASEKALYPAHQPSVSPRRSRLGVTTITSLQSVAGILLQNTPSCLSFLLHLSSVVVQVADVTTGTPFFMGLDVLRTNGPTVITELGILLYMLYNVWRHPALSHGQ